MRTQIKTSLSILRQNTSTYLALASGWLIVALMLVVFYEVFMRFVFNRPPGWAIEIPRLMFLVIIFLGLGYTTRIGGHVSLDILTMRLSRRRLGLLQTITSFLALVMTAVLLWQSVNILVRSFVQQWRTATVVPVIEWPFYVAMVLGSFLMGIEWIGKIVAGWHNFRHPVEHPAQPEPERGI